MVVGSVKAMAQTTMKTMQGNRGVVQVEAGEEGRGVAVAVVVVVGHREVETRIRQGSLTMLNS